MEKSNVLSKYESFMKRNIDGKRYDDILKALKRKPNA